MPELFSSCCGSTEQTDIPFNTDGGFCPECRDHCGYITAEEFEVGPDGMIVTEPITVPSTPLSWAMEARI